MKDVFPADSQYPITIIIGKLKNHSPKTIETLCENMKKLLIMNSFFGRETRKYPLSMHILGVLTHTTASDHHKRSDESFKLVLIYIAWFLLA